MGGRIALTRSRASALISVARCSGFNRSTTDEPLPVCRLDGNSSSCMNILLSDRTTSNHVLSLQENIYNSPRMHQVRNAAQHMGRLRRRRNAAQIGPCRGNQRGAAVRQRKDQMQGTLAVHLSQDPQCLPLQWVFLPYYQYALRRVLDMGSLSCSSSIGSTTIG
jgi:hypothetical protein